MKPRVASVVYVVCGQWRWSGRERDELRQAPLASLVRFAYLFDILPRNAFFHHSNSL